MEQLTLAQGGAFGVWANSSGADGNWTEFLTALRWIQFSMVTLSIVGSGSIIGYTALQQLLQHPEIRPLFYLSLTDLMLGLCWLIGVLFHGESFTARNVTCYNLQVMGQVTEQSVRLNMILIILSSLIPVVLMVPVFCVGNIYGCYANYSSSCLLLHTGPSKLNDSYIVDHKSACHIIYLYSTITFLITFFFTLLGLVILLTKMRFRYMKLVTLTRFLGDQQWAMIRVIEWRVFLYPAALLFCWGPASILATVKLLNPMNMSRLYFVLYILQALTAPSQGLLNCIVYGWTQRMFRYMKQKAYCDADTQTPLLRFQKQSYHSTRSANVINQLPISPTT
ncbi:transmembrane protein 116 isoform X3 [Pristis pectinata]|uniref:transmembrane protein 116 isoform X3 n=1 Tax=Pristis pectinata TaxID=685728 RepID=UPI00223D46E3|nr:transmembrane protein 116 isoform X3 [Pristis pectinata]